MSSEPEARRRLSAGSSATPAASQDLADRSWRENTATRSAARPLIVVLALLATLLLSLALTSRADALIYYSHGLVGGWGSTSIGRADLDGSDPDNGFIGRVGLLADLAVDDDHIYWAPSLPSQGLIGRANVDGTGVDGSFITGLDFGDNFTNLTVDASHIYWAGGDGIGRANLNGTGVDESFIPLTTAPRSVAVDANYVYWTQFGGTAIGRANLDGTGVDESFITGLNDLTGVAVDANHIYWGSSIGIGRANVDGTGVDEGFITGLNDVFDIAVDANHVYWVVASGRSIGRADLDGGNPDGEFIGGTRAIGIAVDSRTFLDTTITSGPEGATRDNSPSFTFSSDKPGSTFECRLDSAAWSGCSSPKQYSELSDGPYTFGVRATDQEGTTGPVASRKFTIDTELKASAEAKRTQTRKNKILVKVKLRTKEEVAFAAGAGRLRVQGSSYELKPEEIKVRDANSPKNLKLKPKKRDRKRIRKALNRGKTAKARVKVRFSDEAGNKKTEKLSVKLKR